MHQPWHEDGLDLAGHDGQNFDVEESMTVGTRIYT
jgi:hypothetical protein